MRSRTYSGEGDFDLAEFNDYELIEELKVRGIAVPADFTKYECEYLLTLMGSPKPGSEEHSLQEKIRSIYYDRW